MGLLLRTEIHLGVAGNFDDLGRFGLAFVPHEGLTLRPERLQ